MAYKSVRISDLTGKEGKDEDFITLIVRQHPSLDEPVQIDVLPNEIKSLQNADDLVILELRNADDEQLVVTLEDFNKLSPKIDEILASADGLRGRRKGYRPSNKDGSANGSAGKDS